VGVGVGRQLYWIVPVESSLLVRRFLALNTLYTNWWLVIMPLLGSSVTDRKTECSQLLVDLLSVAFHVVIQQRRSSRNK
jgi:hypothetical protein